MTDTPKILGRVAPLSGAITDLYTVPAATNTVISTIIVCNTTGTQQSWNLYTAPNGEPNWTADTVFQFVPLAGNQSQTLTLGITLAATDKVRGLCSASGAVTFNLYGVEVT